MTAPTQPNTIGIQIPNFLHSPVVEKREDGNYYFTSDWHNVMQQTFKQLQTNLSQEGVKIPQQPTTTIAQLNTSKSVGNLLYDSEAKTLMVNIDGTYKTVQTS